MDLTNGFPCRVHSSTLPGHARQDRYCTGVADVRAAGRLGSATPSPVTNC